MYKIILALILITTLRTFGQSNKWKSLHEKNYSIEYPEKWELNRSNEMGTSFIIFSELTSEKDQFRENVNLVVQDLTGQNIDLDKYIKLSESQIKTLITDGNIISSDRFNKKGYEFHKLVSTGKQGVFNLKFELYIWVQNNKAYVLTLTCEMSEFNNFKNEGEKILDSFKIK